MTILQSSLLNAPSSLVKLDLLATVQAFLQGTANLHRLNSSGKLEWQLGVVQASGSKLVGLRNESFGETAVVVRWDLPSNTGRLRHLNQSSQRISIDRQLPFCTDDLGHVMLTSCHDPATIKVCNLASPELDDTNTIVHVLVFAKIRLDGSNSYCIRALDNTILAKVPEREIDIVNVAINKDAAGELCILDKETRRVELITGLRSEDRGSSYGSVVHPVPRIAVGGVKSPRKATHDFEVRLLVGGVHNRL